MLCRQFCTLVLGVGGAQRTPCSARWLSQSLVGDIDASRLNSARGLGHTVLGERHRDVDTGVEIVVHKERRSCSR
jgi:hypothetical protein